MMKRLEICSLQNCGRYRKVCGRPTPIQQGKYRHYGNKESVNNNSLTSKLLPNPPTTDPVREISRVTTVCQRVEVLLYINLAGNGTSTNYKSRHSSVTTSPSAVVTYRDPGIPEKLRLRKLFFRHYTWGGWKSFLFSGRVRVRQRSRAGR